MMRNMLKSGLWCNTKLERGIYFVFNRLRKHYSTFLTLFTFTIKVSTDKLFDKGLLLKNLREKPTSLKGICTIRYFHEISIL